MLGSGTPLHEVLKRAADGFKRTLGMAREFTKEIFRIGLESVKG